MINILGKWHALMGLLGFFFLRICNLRKITCLGKNYFHSGTLKVRNGAHFSVEKNNIFSKGFDVEVQGVLTVGSRNFFNKNVKIICFDKIVIGNDCLFADSVHLYDHDHNFSDTDIPIAKQGYTSASILIGNNVWLGAKVTVLKGVKIAEGVIVGANSVVTKDLPPFSICGGVPAKVIKFRKLSKPL